jgi:hypothetical protein
MNRHIRSFGGLVPTLVIVFLTLSAPLAAAATLTGSVTDRQGKVVVSASVLILTADRGAVASAATDGNGRFSIADLSAGVLSDRCQQRRVRRTACRREPR